MFLTFLRTCVSFYRNLISGFNHRIPTDFLDQGSSVHLMIRTFRGQCCYDTMHVFASKTTPDESLFNLGISFKSRRFGKILKTLQQDKTKIWSLDLLFNFENSCVSTAGPEKRNRDRPLVGS